MNERWLPQEGRPRALLSRLDEAYLAFARGLPPHLKHAALEKGTYTGQPGDGSLPGVSCLNPVLAASPWLFWDTFCHVDDEAYLRIAEAGAMLVLASLLLDHLVDGQAGDPAVVLLLVQALHARSVALFRRLSAAHGAFWDQFERLEARHLAALELEAALRRRPRKYEAADVQVIARGKAAPVVVTLTAMATASGSSAHVSEMEASLGHAVAASLFADDVKDWRQDLDAGRLTPFLMRLEPAEAWVRSPWPPPEKVQAQIQAGWVDVEHLREASASLDAALSAVDGVACSHWKRYLEDHRKLAEHHVAGCVARHVAHVARSLFSTGEVQ